MAAEEQTNSSRQWFVTVSYNLPKCKWSVNECDCFYLIACESVLCIFQRDIAVYATPHIVLQNYTKYEQLQYDMTRITDESLMVNIHCNHWFLGENTEYNNDRVVIKVRMYQMDTGYGAAKPYTWYDI